MFVELDMQTDTRTKKYFTIIHGRFGIILLIKDIYSFFERGDAEYVYTWNRKSILV